MSVRTFYRRRIIGIAIVIREAKLVEFLIRIPLARFGIFVLLVRVNIAGVLFETVPLEEKRRRVGILDAVVQASASPPV